MLTSNASCAREMDRTPSDLVLPAGQIDPTPLLGEWSNTNHRSWGISHAELVQQDGGLEMRIIGTDPQDKPHDWGRAPVTRLFTDGPGSSRACAYTATFELAHARTEIQAEVKQGVSIMAALTSFTDGSGRSSYMSREFMTRRELPATPSTPLGTGVTAARPAAARGEDRLGMLRGGIDPTILLRRWTNTNQASRGIAEIRCELRDGQFQVRVVAVGPQGPIDWDEAAATLYSDIGITGGGRAAAEPVTDGRPTPNYADISVTDAGPAFWATYDHGFQRVHLQARINLGLLVVVVFTEFNDDSGRADYYHREFFVRES